MAELPSKDVVWTYAKPDEREWAIENLRIAAGLTSVIPVRELEVSESPAFDSLVRFALVHRDWGDPGSMG